MKDLLLCLKPNQRKGSKPRCHRFTHGTREQVARRLTKLIRPWGTVSADDCWMPEGFCQIEEAQLHKATKLLPQEQCNILGKWWFAEQNECSKSPSFDIASTCTINGTEGMLLVEAKAHSAELKVDDSANGSCANLTRIEECIQEANAKMTAQTKSVWALSHKHRYQIANRFAWSSKLLEEGYHVILVYLGFLNAEEMLKGQTPGRPPRIPFANNSEWESYVESYSKPVLPTEAWNNQRTLHSRIFVPRILSCEIPYNTRIEDD